MWSYEAPLQDMQFVLFELLPALEDWRRIGAFAELDAATVVEILSGGARFAGERLAPLNAGGDLEGCHFEHGAVRAPQGFAEAYREFCRAGWPALACDRDCGGQGLPQLLNAALYEMLNAANHAWAMYPGLAHGAYECLRAFAPAAIKRAYLPKIVDGSWLATMCLTEAQAGSDLGRITTSAHPLADGEYAIRGTKVFISGGEHDLTENIVHMVLARLPDAPAGSRGLSLFLVPKLLLSPTGLAGNTVHCDGIEAKLGIHGSATCVMRFEDARGSLIGAPHRGLAAMFVMMNAARLHVGLQGLGHAELAYQNARRYAFERVQLRPVCVSGAPGTTPAADSAPIAHHPAVHRTLLTLRAYTEGQRALAYWCAHLLDIAQQHPEASERTQATDLAALLTPLVKCFLTDNGFSLASAALQVWGGYGYLRDYGVEQCLRDSRITMIYEGTNEIQALDLLLRKVVQDRGARFAVLLQGLRTDAARCREASLESFAAPLETLVAEFARTTAELIVDAAHEPELPHRVAGDFVRVLGLLVLASLWARTARVAAAKDLTDRFYQQKLETACFYFDYLLPEATLRLQLIERGRRSLPALDP